MADPNATLTTVTPNGTVVENADETSFIFLVIVGICAGLWIIYLTFYHSRVLGYILTEFVNFKYMHDGQYFKIGMYIQ